MRKCDVITSPSKYLPGLRSSFSQYSCRSLFTKKVVNEWTWMQRTQLSDHFLHTKIMNVCAEKGFVLSFLDPATNPTSDYIIAKDPFLLPSCKSIPWLVRKFDPLEISALQSEGATLAPFLTVSFSPSIYFLFFFLLSSSFSLFSFGSRKQFWRSTLPDGETRRNETAASSENPISVTSELKAVRRYGGITRVTVECCTVRTPGVFSHDRMAIFRETDARAPFARLPAVGTGCPSANNAMGLVSSDVAF